MMKDAKIKLGFLLLGLAITPFWANGQDLGSGNGLFRTSNPPAKTAKKTAPKPKTSAEKSAPAKSSAAKKEPTKKETSKSTARTSTKKDSAKTTAKTNIKTYDKTGSISTKSKTVTAKSASQPVVQPTKIAASGPPQNDIVINVGQKTSGDFDELYEVAIDEGNTARDERSYTVAENSYRRAQSLKPRDSRAIYGLGNLYSDQQRWEEAERAYRQAIQLEPDSPEAHIALSFVLSQPVVGANLGDRYMEAEKMARRAIQLDANNPVAYDQLGAALELRGIIEQETQNAYRKAIELDPNFALAYAHLGRILRRNGLTNESSAAYQDAIRYATDVPTMILVADVMQSQQRFAESEQLLRRALRDDPKNPTALFLLGRALTTRGSFDEAEKVLKSSLEVSPNSFVSYALLGSLYSRTNKFEDAERILLKALQVISVNERKRLSQEFELVGDGFLKAGKGKDAARVYRQAISLNGENSLLINKLNRAQRS
jgi:tetratricopeptide (TPR) repeat protein